MNRVSNLSQLVARTAGQSVSNLFISNHNS